jgi:hypothetical protein
VDAESGDVVADVAADRVEEEDEEEERAEDAPRECERSKSETGCAWSCPECDRMLSVLIWTVIPCSALGRR